MTVEIIEAIGMYIVTPIMFFGFFIYLIYLESKGD